MASKNYYSTIYAVQRQLDNTYNVVLLEPRKKVTVISQHPTKAEAEAEVNDLNSHVDVYQILPKPFNEWFEDKLRQKNKNK